MIKALLLYITILLTGFEAGSKANLKGINDSTLITGPGEKISLFTDRDLYCVNEKIFFTSYYSCENEIDSLLWSNVLYVELIKWNGVKLARLKLKQDESGSSGFIKIPGDLLSGNYYLRAYTKWMRNFPVTSYIYRKIKIVNPFEAALESSPAEMTERSGIQINEVNHKKSIKRIRCATDKSVYQTREKVEVEFNFNDTVAFCNDYCVSVVKAGSLDTTFLFNQPETKSYKLRREEIEYLPEIRGMTISGKILDKTLGDPKKNIFVTISEPLNGEYFSVNQADDKGRFVFSLPNLYGKYDFFIQAEAKDTGQFSIIIDDGFCNRPVSLPYIPFSLNEDEKQLIREMTVNIQLNEKFFINDDTSAIHFLSHQPVPFYGSIMKTYLTEKYIELTDIGEFLFEIVPEALIENKKGEAVLTNSGRNSFSNYPPLIFLDNIQINNDDRLLKLPLNRIERVDASESGYVIGKMKYNGVISIYTKNKDFGGIDLTGNGMFFNYELFSDQNSCYMPRRNISDSRIPDRHNLLYWEPDVKLSASQKTSLSFNTSDNTGDYVIYIFGKDHQDEYHVFGSCEFSVK